MNLNIFKENDTTNDNNLIDTNFNSAEAILKRNAILNENNKVIESEPITGDRKLISDGINNEQTQNEQVFTSDISFDLLTKVFKYKGTEFSSGEFQQIEDSKDFIAVRTVERKKCKAMGIVLYATKDEYSTDKEINKKIHLFGEDIQKKEEFVKRVFVFFQALNKVYYNFEIDNIIAGHEHGENNGKCHLQIIIEFKKETDLKMFPGEFYLNDINYIFMAQKARNSKALQNYCKKDGDFFYLYPDKAIRFIYKKDKKGIATDKLDAFATVVQNPELSKEEKMDLLLTYEPRTALTMYKNLEYAIDKQTTESVINFEWVYPGHLSGEYRRVVTNWYNNYCVPDLSRRKCLFIYGEPNCGKTQLAKRLVNHESYYVYCRSNFNSDDLANKSPKLLILDDMEFLNSKNHETFKALMSGEHTSIRDCYVNYAWKHMVPCIMITNKKSMFKYIYNHPEYKSRCVYLTISPGDYLGPPGTEPNNDCSMEGYIYPEMQNFIEKTYEIRNDNESKTDFSDRKRDRSRDKEILELRNKNLNLEEENKKLLSMLSNYKNFLDASCPTNNITSSMIFKK